MKSPIRLVLSICVALLAPLALAAPPLTINYQGYLTNTVGTPISSTVGMTFKFYSVASAGTLLHTEVQPAVAVIMNPFVVSLSNHCQTVSKSDLISGTLALEQEQDTV